MKPSIGLIITLVSGVAGVASSAALVEFKARTSHERVERVESKVHEHDVRLGKTDTALDGIQKTLDRIDRNVESMSRERR